MRDIRVSYFSGSGAGGQNRNKVQACCRLTHVPTGITKTAQTRSRENSYRLASEALREELSRLHASARAAAENGVRRHQVGSGERSDKRRTYRFQEDRVLDHVTGRRATCSEVMSGAWHRLW